MHLLPGIYNSTLLGRVFYTEGVCACVYITVDISGMQGLIGIKHG